MSDNENKSFARLGIYGLVPVKIYHDTSLKPNDVIIYGALSSFQGGSKNCFPSQEEIAKRSNKSTDAVSTALKNLKARGWINVIRRGRGKTNVYECLCPIEIVEEKEDLRVNNRFKKQELIQNQEVIKTLENIHGEKQEKIRVLDSGKNPKSIEEKKKGKDHSKRKVYELPKADPLLNQIRDKFKEVNPNYYHDGKEAKNIKRLIEKSISLNHNILELIIKFKKIVDTAKEQFWKEQPLTPSRLLSLYDSVIAKKIEAEESEETMEERLARIDRMKAEGTWL